MDLIDVTLAATLQIYENREDDLAEKLDQISEKQKDDLLQYTADEVLRIVFPKEHNNPALHKLMVARAISTADKLEEEL